jgi:hypothetical protein
MDCFVDIAIPNCDCPPASGFNIVSPKPFYKSRIDFNSLNLKIPIAISDTSLFNKIDTVRNNLNQVTCWLPSTIFSYDGSMNNLRDSTIILKTTLNKYVMVQIMPLVTEEKLFCTDVTQHWFFYLHGIVLAWYLQNNGSLDFSEVNQTVINFYSKRKDRNQKLLSQINILKKYHIGMGKDLVRGNGGIFYSLKGERLVGINLKKINTLIVYK